MKHFQAPISSLRWLVAAVLLASATVPAHALPGELEAVMRHCGVPHAQNYTTSQVTGRPQRDLIYNASTLLHFEPEEGGWSFTTAWEGHFPVTRSMLESRLPCFKAAMDEVAAAPAPVIDPTIAEQTANPAPVSQSNFGIDHMWLIIVLVVATALLVLLPRRRRAATNPSFSRTCAATASPCCAEGSSAEDPGHRKFSQQVSESASQRVSESAGQHVSRSARQG